MLTNWAEPHGRGQLGVQDSDMHLITVLFMHLKQQVIEDFGHSFQASSPGLGSNKKHLQLFCIQTFQQVWFNSSKQKGTKKRTGPFSSLSCLCKVMRLQLLRDQVSRIPWHLEMPRTSRTKDPRPAAGCGAEIFSTPLEGLHSSTRPQTSQIAVGKRRQNSRCRKNGDSTISTPRFLFAS